MKPRFLLVLLICGTSCGTPPSDSAATYDAFARDARPGTSRWDGRFGQDYSGLPGAVERDVLRR